MAHPAVLSPSLALPLALAVTLTACGGGGAASGPADPSLPGAYAVNRATAQVSSDVSATRCAPSRDAGATAAAGPFPLVLFVGGHQLDRSQYDSACTHLASWGLVALVLPGGGVTSSVQDEAAGVRAALDWALSTASGLAGAVDAAAVAAAGHSSGGTAAVLAAALDPRIRVVVGWDPVDSSSHSVAPELMVGFTRPLAVLGETLDAGGSFQACAPAADNFTQFFAAADGPALQVTLTGAAHMDFLDDRAACGFGCSTCQTGTADGAVVRSLARRTTVAFLRRHLLGEAAMDRWLTGAGMQADATAGRLAFTSK